MTILTFTSILPQHPSLLLLGRWGHYTKSLVINQRQIKFASASVSVRLSMKLCAALQSLREMPCALCMSVCVCVLVVIAVVVAAATVSYLVPHEHLNAVEQFGSFSASKFSLEINNARSTYCVCLLPRLLRPLCCHSSTAISHSSRRRRHGGHHWPPRRSSVCA